MFRSMLRTMVGSMVNSMVGGMVGNLVGSMVSNMGIMLGPTLLQPAVGWMLDRNWNGELVDSMRVYSIAAYHAGFMLMIVWAALSFVLLFFTRETYCRQRK